MPSRKVVAEPPQLVVPAACAKHHGAVGQVAPAVWGAIAFIVLQKTKKAPIVLRNRTEELRPR